MPDSAGMRSPRTGVWVLFLALIAAGACSAEPVWVCDFEQELPDLPAGARISAGPSETLTGKASLVMDSTGSDQEWNELFTTSPAQVRFQPGRTYYVSFRYRILDAGEDRTRFYSLLRSGEAGDIYGPFWLWNREQGAEGVIHRIFQPERAEDWRLIIGVRHRGKLAVDDIRVNLCKGDPPGYGLNVKPGPPDVLSRRRALDVRREKDGLPGILSDMVVIWCNEGAGEKIAAEGPRRAFAAEHNPDFVDWNPCGPMAKEFGVRTSRGGPEYQEYYRFEGPDLWDARYRIFGDNGFQVSLDGTFIRDETWGEGGYFTCHIAPGWHGWFIGELLKKSSDLLAVCQDNIACAPFYKGHGCFCRFCLEGFRRWLRRRYTPEELVRFGIPDIGRFDYRERVCRYGLVGNRALGDPVVREYVKYQFVSHLLAWADVVERVKDAGRVRGLVLPVYGNQIGAFGMWPFAAAIGQFCDVIEIEEVTVAGREIPNWGVMYRMGRACAHEKRPVWVRGPVLDGLQERSGQMSPLFWTAHFGQALANGGARVISFGVNAPWTGDPRTKDYIDIPELRALWRDYAAFCHANRALLTRRESQAKVALIYSLPSVMYRRFYPQQIDDHAPFSAFHQTSLWLDRMHVLHDAVIFGHPELFETDTAGLAKYSAVVLPAADALTESQLDWLRRFAAKGGIVATLGPVGVLDQDLNPRGDVRLEGPRVFDLKADRAAALKELRNVSPVRVDGPEEVTVNVWRSAGGASLDVHLVNYGADLVRGEWTATGPVTVRVRVPTGMRVGDAHLLQFGAAQREIEVRMQDGWASFTVPSVKGYCLVSLGDRAAILRANREAAQRIARDKERVRNLAREKDLY